MGEEIALLLWREREMAFPPFVRRMNPDDLDRVSGAWDAMLQAADRLSRGDGK